MSRVATLLLPLLLLQSSSQAAVTLEMLPVDASLDMHWPCATAACLMQSFDAFMRVDGAYGDVSSGTRLQRPNLAEAPFDGEYRTVQTAPQRINATSRYQNFTVGLWSTKLRYFLYPDVVEELVLDVIRRHAEDGDHTVTYTFENPREEPRWLRLRLTCSPVDECQRWMASDVFDSSASADAATPTGLPATSSSSLPPLVATPTVTDEDRLAATTTTMTSTTSTTSTSATTVVMPTVTPSLGIPDPSTVYEDSSSSVDPPAELVSSSSSSSKTAPPPPPTTLEMPLTQASAVDDVEAGSLWASLSILVALICAGVAVAVAGVAGKRWYERHHGSGKPDFDTHSSGVQAFHNPTYDEGVASGYKPMVLYDNETALRGSPVWGSDVVPAEYATIESVESRPLPPVPSTVAIYDAATPSDSDT